jgi:trehalose 6-phosphate synthase
MGRLVVASNRTASPDAPRAGGLAVAIWDALIDRGGGVWFGWSGEALERETRGVRVFAEGPVDFALADLTTEERDGYYLGYANHALWPICHYRVDLAVFDDAAFAVYEAVNRRFGRLLAPLLRPGDTVWAHDYHFLPLGAELRACGWRDAIGFFLHIPFPAPEVFAALPQHQRLGRAMAAYDLIGLQTRRDADNFRRYMTGYLDAVEEPDGRLLVDDRSIRVEAFPIGIDADEFARAAGAPEGQAAAARLGRILENRDLVIGVDRMDYSKGLPQRLQAFGRLLDEDEALRGRVSFLQIAPPSRESVDAYQQLREELDRLAGRINGDYGDIDWIPIRYLARSYPREALAGLYRRARVGMVTPLWDGMNLVAKEFVAAQAAEDPGALVLSEFAGAAEQLDGALLVNPHDVAAMAAAVRRALDMPLEERRERWVSLDRAVRDQDVAWWRRAFLDALDAETARRAVPPAPDRALAS